MMFRDQRGSERDQRCVPRSTDQKEQGTERQSGVERRGHRSFGRVQTTASIDIVIGSRSTIVTTLSIRGTPASILTASRMSFATSHHDWMIRITDARTESGRSRHSAMTIARSRSASGTTVALLVATSGRGVALAAAC